jgi:methanogenic corrinoid protein MtbC1
MGSFGENIRNIRKEKKLSQKKVAEQLGVGQTTIANYENDLRFPNPMVLSKLSDVLDVSVDKLLGKKVPETKALDKDFNHAKLFINHVLNYEDEAAIKFIINLAENGYDILDIYDQILKKTLYTIGDLWKENRLSVSKEHYITEIVQKALFILSSYNKKNRISGKTAIFMTTSSEPHLIGLKIVKETFKRYGWKTFYLGNSVPWDSLIGWIKEHHADLVVLSATIAENVNQIEALVNYIRANTNAKIMVGGQAYHLKPHLLEQVQPDYYHSSNEELIRFLNQMNDDNGKLNE